MGLDLSGVTISATKPRRRPAALLADMGISVVPIDVEEGNVDRYILSKRLVIERRTGGGFLQGIMDKTLFTSAVYLREHFRLPVLIVEGETASAYRGFDPQAVRGALSSMMLLYAINVLRTPNTEETAQLIAMMARQEQIGIPEISLIPKRKAADLPDLQRRVIEMLPGAGMVAARQLLQHFGSVQRIVGATEDELRSLKGIGAKKAKAMHRTLNAEYRSVDTERDLEDAIVEAPDLLFKQPVTLVARQHHIYTEDKQRHVVDLVFLDIEGDELVLVELKRGRLARDHEAQLCRYLDRASESPLLRPFLAHGRRCRGLLATVEPCEFEPKCPDVLARVVDKKRVIDMLVERRRRRLGEGAMAGEDT